MGRLLAFILGGGALALYGPYLFLPEVELNQYVAWWKNLLGDAWYAKTFTYGPGTLAGFALVLLAIRGKD